MQYITGSTGFVGKHLLKELDNVVAIPHKEIPTFEFKPFDSFFFLSTYGNMHHHEENGKIWQANVVDLLSVLNKVIKLGFKSFVYISTSSVKLKVQTMYSRSKKAAEEILLSYMEKYNLPITVIRPFSITGVGEQDTHLIPTLIRSCVDQKLVNFTPKPTHDFIDVSDIVSGIMNLSQHSARGIFELGTGNIYTNQQVLKMVEEVTNKKAVINQVHSLRDYDSEDWVSTNFRARSYGWMPSVLLKESITNMVREYQGEM